MKALTPFRLSLLWVGLAYGQIGESDSLRRLFEKDFSFDIVFNRTFPIITVVSDTHPISAILSGHFRLGLRWHWRLWRGWHFTVQPGFTWSRQVFRATSASRVPYADLMPEGYRWLRYRMGAVSLQAGIHWRRKVPTDLLPRFWIEVGGWLQRVIGSSLKYVAERNGITEKNRWEGLTLFTPWQAGVYASAGRRWFGITAYYYLLPLFPTEPVGDRYFPRTPAWEVGFCLSL
ncbi:MAG: hypothetical protein ABDH91_08045 [Bacteroidia bacterium]